MRTVVGGGSVSAGRAPISGVDRDHVVPGLTRTRPSRGDPAPNAGELDKNRSRPRGRGRPRRIIGAWQITAMGLRQCRPELKELG